MSTNNNNFPYLLVNITNKCNLRCKHCYWYREENPVDEIELDHAIKQLREIKKKHNVMGVDWAGGEPLLNPDLLKVGTKMFPYNIVKTNGTQDLLELANTTYFIALDGPPEIHNHIRGKGVYEKVMAKLSQYPRKFKSVIVSQTVVNRLNEDLMEDFVGSLRNTRLEKMFIAFYVPAKNEDSEFMWKTIEERDKAVKIMIGLKKKYPQFIWNSLRSFELLLSPTAKAISDRCVARKLVLPFRLRDGNFERVHCCYGDGSADCDLCGGWFHYGAEAYLEKFFLKHVFVGSPSWLRGLYARTFLRAMPLRDW